MAAKPPPHSMVDGKPHSLLDLGTDILVVILDLLPARDAKSMSLVDSTLHHLAKYSAHRKITVDTTQEGYESTMKHLAAMERDDLLPAVRYIEVMDLGKGADVDLRQQKRSPMFDFLHAQKPKPKPLTKVAYDDRVDLICRYISPMTGLRQVQWSARNIPDVAIKALQERPEVKLMANNQERHWRPNIDDGSIFISLQGNHNLHSLEVNHCYTSVETCLMVTEPLKDLLLSCPSLRVLKLNMFMPKSGCVHYSLPWDHPDIGCKFENGEKPPPLEHLDIVEYPFGRSEMVFWVQNFDWSRLQTLRCDPVFALAVMPKLAALKDITLYNAWKDDDAIRLYMEIPSKLEAISVPRLRNITADGITRHGAALQKLTLHQNESWGKDWKGEAIDDNSLQLIQAECPNIEEMDLDIAREGEWPYSTLEILASFPRLHSLTLHFELGLGDNEPLSKPFVTFSAANMLFQYLHSRNPRIKKLSLHSGSPPPIGLGFPSPMAFWPERNSTSFDCVLSERDDEAALGKFKVTCAKVDDEVNEIMRAMVDAKDETESEAIRNRYKNKHAKEVKKMRMPPMEDFYMTFPIAWDGPISRDQFAAMGAMW